jgi:hypothetical protein
MVPLPSAIAFIVTPGLSISAYPEYIVDDNDL